jgi:hypothetical protein
MCQGMFSDSWKVTCSFVLVLTAEDWLVVRKFGMREGRRRTD